MRTKHIKLDAARFLDRIDRGGGPESCWPWLGGKDRQGYGIATFLGKSRRAPRIAYFLHFGKWPSDDVLHSCDNPVCVNPLHLFNGTNADNVADRVAKGREGDRRGERNGQARLSAVQVFEIRRRYAFERTTAKQFAAEYGVSVPAIYKVLSGRTWKHLL